MAYVRVAYHDEEMGRNLRIRISESDSSGEQNFAGGHDFYFYFFMELF